MLKIYCIAFLGVFPLVSLGSPLMVPLGDRYFVSEYKASFVHALAVCKMMDMDLLSIQSEAESESVYDIMNSAGLAVVGRSYWMGGAHLDVDTWVWIDTGKLLTFVKWGANEPSLPTSEDYCLQLGKDNDGRNPRFWQSRLCSTESYYVCQVKET
ncbi:perlucin [Dendroctonus ponderosae]|uniref:C-type lectin domain-containing protein n=1 Tax=Dendroctonus ponderosae TaxID=77166 RepID=U4U3G3_DENPD|nr:perlucin [Dendroctonus ponderosae]ERL88419.1 hypothetical protein D910_05805 [Dendroctonus ponderosae]KAH1024977.1 hypothetical protein HUJ05_009797 [Dendroctonus ponderosae]